jgi:hypothetical protein
VRLILKIKKRLHWLIEDILWIFYRWFYNPPKHIEGITIGITTFMDRYKNCLKPLLRKVAVVFPENQIIVIANGHVKSTEQLIYLEQMMSFCKLFSNVKLITFQDPKGLSFLWNQIILNSVNKSILILNDDLKIKYKFSNWLANVTIGNSIMIINKSWSHFIISKKVIDTVGWFDEGLIEIGGEDDDYSARLAIHEVKIKHICSNAINGKLRKKKKMLAYNSYGRNMFEEKDGYSSYNSAYLGRKWDTRNEYFEGATKVSDRSMKYWKLRKNVNES